MIYYKIIQLASKGFDISICFYTDKNLSRNMSRLGNLAERICVAKDFLPLIYKNLRCTIVEMAEYISKIPPRSIKEGFNGTMLSNIGDFSALDNFCSDAILCGDISLNIYNSASAKFYCDIAKAHGKMLSSVAVSPELPFYMQIKTAKNIIDNNITRPEIIAYGRLPVMKCEHCVISGMAEPVLPGNDKISPSFKCGNCNTTGIFYLKDEKGFEYPVIPVPKYCQSIVFSSKVLDYTDFLLNTDIFGDEKPILRFNILYEEI